MKIVLALEGLVLVTTRIINVQPFHSGTSMKKNNSWSSRIKARLKEHWLHRASSKTKPILKDTMILLFCCNGRLFSCSQGWPAEESQTQSYHEGETTGGVQQEDQTRLTLTYDLEENEGQEPRQSTVHGKQNIFIMTWNETFIELVKTLHFCRNTKFKGNLLEAFSSLKL